MACVAGPTSTAVTLPAGLMKNVVGGPVTPYRSAMAPPGSLMAGQRSPFLSRKARAVDVVSWNTTLTMSAPSVVCVCS